MIYYLALFIIGIVIIGYVFGSISFSIIIGKVVFKKDLRLFESKNAGATNASRIYGKKWGILVLILDMLKTIIPTIAVWLITRYLLIDYINVIGNKQLVYTLIYLLPFFAIVGHCYPLFFHFKGGKGAASYGAFLFIISPFLGLFCLAFLALLVYKSKKVSLSVLLIGLIAPFLVYIPGLNYLFIVNVNISELIFIDYNAFVTVSFISFLLALSSIIVFYKHKQNILRIFNHDERLLKKI